jgi:GT2 family glycosyltransferase
MNVGVVILNWKGWRDTLICLASLLQSTQVRLRVVVIDNGSQDESVAQIQKWLRLSGPEHPNVQIELHPLDQNFGFAEGCNRGLQILRASQDCDFYLLLNNDTTLEPGTLSEMIRVSHLAQADLIGAHVLTEDRAHTLYQGRSWPGHLFGRGAMVQDPQAEIWPTDQVDGSCLMMTASFLEERWRASGYALDPELFLYCEDSDLAIFGKHHGFKAVVAARALVYHGLSKSSGGAGNPRSFYYISRNRIYLANRWLNAPMRVLFHLYYILSRSALVILYRLKGRRSVSRAIYQGVIDGYSGVRGPLLEVLSEE